ncbi:MAG: conjugal transfer protein TraH [Sphingobacteriia bacterium]|nr:conjugal transfer protein TraH [Sphingobacteriia bacterium]
MQVIRYIIVAVLLIVTTEAKASNLTHLNEFFNKMGAKGNVSQGGAYKHQQGGYYTGGSLFYRTPARNKNLFKLQTPSMRSGCGGIDLFAGGFSYISSDQLVLLLKDIGSKTMAYGFTLALDHMTPTVSNSLKYLQTLAQRMNNTNINSCEAAATVVGGLWPKTDASTRLLCNSMGTSYGKFSDYAQARQKCGSENGMEGLTDSNNIYKNVLKDEFNIAWEALKDSSFLGDESTKELFMTISGTIIAKKKGLTTIKGNKGKGVADTNYEIIYLASKALESGLIDTLLYGGNAEIYTCKDRQGKCLEVSEVSTALNLSIHEQKPQKVNTSIGLVQKVDNILRELSRKIADDEELSEAEKSFIESTNFPIQKMLVVQTAFRRGSSAISVSEYSEAIAYDILFNYLESVIDIVTHNATSLRYVQINDELLSDFRKQNLQIRKLINSKKHSVYERLSTLINVIERSKNIEKQMHHLFDQSVNREGL